MKEFKVVMRPHNSEMELRRFCNDLKIIAGDSPKIVELGAYMGESSLIFAQEFPKGEIICIDTWQGGYDDQDSASFADYKEVEEQFDLRASVVNNIRKIKGDSRSEKIICDVVYIDACHKYKCVFDDIVHWTPLVSKVVSGHDYQTDEFIKENPHISGVKVAVNELLGKPQKVYGDGTWMKIIHPFFSIDK